MNTQIACMNRILYLVMAKRVQLPLTSPISYSSILVVRDDAPVALAASSDQAVDDTEATLKKSQEEKENKDKENTQLLDEIDLVRRMEDKDSLYEYAMKNIRRF